VFGSAFGFDPWRVSHPWSRLRAPSLLVVIRRLRLRLRG
jgi:hypothetical protein